MIFDDQEMQILASIIAFWFGTQAFQEMKVSDKAIKMIKHHEGVRQRPYRCPAKLWTIGVGHVLYPRQAQLKMEERDAYPLEDTR